MKTVRCWLCVVLSSVFLLSLMHLAEGAETMKSDRYLLYVGTYTRGSDSEGIYCLDLDVPSGKMTKLGVTGGIANPSFLTISPDRKFLYSVSEITDESGKPAGGVSAFSIDRKTGKLTPLNSVSSGGAGPCHVTVDPTGKSVLVANYGGGSVAALRVDETGALHTSSFAQHEGSSADPRRQTAPHAHSINVDASGLRAYAPDLGIDHIVIYKLDPANAALTPNEPAFASLAPGAGPRHFDFHPNGKFAYAINELDNTITGFQVDEKTGGLTTIESVSTLPEGYDKTTYTADIHVHPNGRFLYGSNRGHDSLAVFAINPQTGKLTFVQHQLTLGKNPRNFAIDPTGRVLLAENQDSNTIFSFFIDQETGKLSPTGQSIEIPKPVCIQFVAP